MEIPDIDKNIVIMDSKKKGMIFNLQSTLDHPDFLRYFRNREKLPNVPAKNWIGTFGRELVKHFETAYQTLSALDDSEYEVYDDNKHPFDKDIPDEEL